MKLVIALMQHETNTFSPAAPPRTERSGAAPVSTNRRPDVRRSRRFAETDMPIGAFLDIAERQGAEVVVPVAGYAEPSGPVDDDAFDRMAAPILDAIAAGCDAVLLDLHGAMVTQSHDDGEGELLRRIRAIDPSVPIGVALDFHTNMTAAMVDNASVITGYCTYPHTDMYQTGERCARTILRCLDGEVRPRMTWGALPLIATMLRQTPSAEPMKTPMDMAIAAESDGTVLNASVFGGFPLADIPHVSLSTVVVTDGEDERGPTLRQSILAAAWQRRDGFRFDPEAVEATIAKAKAMDDGPVVIADHGDNAGAGGPMDDMTVIREVVRQGLSDVAAGPIWDPHALKQLRAAGVDTRVTLPVGGKTDSPARGLRGEPLTLTGTVKRITDGRFILEGDMMAGFPVNLDGTAVIDTGDMELVVSGARCEPYALQFFTHAGIDPTRKHYVIVKSRQHFRAGFQAIARHVLMAAGRGVCSESYDSIDFRYLRRPILSIRSRLRVA